MKRAPDGGGSVCRGQCGCTCGFAQGHTGLLSVAGGAGGRRPHRPPAPWWWCVDRRPQRWGRHADGASAHARTQRCVDVPRRTRRGSPHATAAPSWKGVYLLESRRGPLASTARVDRIERVFEKKGACVCELEMFSHLVQAEARTANVACTSCIIRIRRAADACSFFFRRSHIDHYTL